MYPHIRDRLPIPQKIHKQACKAAAIEDLNEIFPGLVALTDASEQSMPQPQHPEAEKAHFSGKAGTHTVKVHKTAHFPGCDHDFKMHKMKHPAFPTGLPNQDGMQGASPAATTSDTTGAPRTWGWTRWSRR